MVTHFSDLSTCKDDLWVKPSKEMICVGWEKVKILHGILMMNTSENVWNLDHTVFHDFL